MSANENVSVLDEAPDAGNHPSEKGVSPKRCPFCNTLAQDGSLPYHVEGCMMDPHTVSIFVRVHAACKRWEVYVPDITEAQLFTLHFLYPGVMAMDRWQRISETGRLPDYLVLPPAHDKAIARWEMETPGDKHPRKYPHASHFKHNRFTVEFPIDEEALGYSASMDLLVRLVKQGKPSIRNSRPRESTVVN